jgi:hypothetical protein
VIRLLLPLLLDEFEATPVDYDKVLTLLAHNDESGPTRMSF